MDPSSSDFTPAPSEAADVPIAPENQRMADLLKEVAAQGDPVQNHYLNEQRVGILEATLKESLSAQERMFYLSHYADDLLHSGRSLEALKAFETFAAAMREKDPESYQADRLRIAMKYAVCWLRYGEQQNCLNHHNPESCLFPIQAGGIHAFEEGSKKAMEILASVLEEDPLHWDARWLIHLAAMTLGTYPDAIHPEWRIPESAFESEVAFPRFAEVAGPLGLDVNGLSGGVIVEDFNGDGRLDVMTSSWSLEHPLAFFVNRGRDGFHDVTQASGLGWVTGGLNMMQTDYNNDGWPDVWILRGAWLSAEGRHPNSLLRNNGDGTFTDVTHDSGLLSLRPTQTAVWFDFNRDGWLDVFIGNESNEAFQYPCELFRNNGDGTFTECAAIHGLDLIGYVKGVTAGDYDRDGWPDLYVSRLRQSNLLMRNELGEASENTTGRFRDVAVAAGVTQPEASFPCWFFDYDNDGWEDLFVSGYRTQGVGDVARDMMGLEFLGEPPRLYRNQGDGTFEDVTKAAGLNHQLYTMGCNFGDLDYDGYLDFYLGTGDPDLGMLMPNRMFRNHEGRRFQDVTAAGGFGHLQKGHGIAFADLDQDGDQDIYQNMGGAYSGDLYRNALYENPGFNNRWIYLRLIGVESNRMAIGARVHVVVNTSTGTRELFRSVNSGGSFGASPLRREIGLGPDVLSIDVEVTWPVSGSSQWFRGLEPNRFFELMEGQDEATPVTIDSFPFAKRNSTEPHVH